MLPSTSRRRAAVLALCVALLLPVGPSWADHANPPGPTHAGNTFGWYPAATRHEFVGPLSSAWKKRGRGSVSNVNGMLTLKTMRRGSLSATLTTPGHATGRWEARMQAVRYRSGHPNYTVRTELIPAGDRKQYCGARNIALQSFRFGQRRTKFYIHNLPDLAFRYGKRGEFGKGNWHTYAVEVTPARISWFVDAHVVATEKRPEALSGVPLTVRFSLKAVPGSRMNRAKMQMDWLRYWTLAKPNDLSTKAPAPTLGVYGKACPPA